MYDYIKYTDGTKSHRDVYDFVVKLVNPSNFALKNCLGIREEKDIIEVGVGAYETVICKDSPNIKSFYVYGDVREVYCGEQFSGEFISTADLSILNCSRSELQDFSNLRHADQLICNRSQTINILKNNVTFSELTINY